MKIRITDPVKFFDEIGRDKTLEVGTEHEALIVRSGDAFIQNPIDDCSVLFIKQGKFDGIHDLPISKEGMINAFQTLREMLGQDIKTVEFK